MIYIDTKARERLYALVDADEATPLADVVEKLQDRLAHAEDVQNGDDAATAIAERVMREVRKDFEGVVASLQEKLNEKTRGLEVENARLRECNDAMREPMRRLREAANMPAQGESAVVGEMLARLDDRDRRLDQIAAAAARVQTTVQRYFDQHGPSCDEHADEPDHTCPTCCIDIDASDAISGLEFWSKP